MHLKSFLTGLLAAGVLAVLIGATTPGADADDLEFVPCAAGMGVYNPATNTLYIYKMWNAKISDKPSQTFKVAADGSQLEAAE